MLDIFAKRVNFQSPFIGLYSNFFLEIPSIFLLLEIFNINIKWLIRFDLCQYFGLSHLQESKCWTQYVARPPDRSKTAPELNEHSPLAIKATIAAHSSTVPNRP